MPKPRANKWRVGLLVVAVLALVVATRTFDIPELFRQLLDWVDRLGPAGVLAFVGIYVAAAVLFIPGSILTLGAGVIFGVFKGTAIVIVSATLGAAAAFLVGRYLARDWVKRKIEGNRRFQAVDEAVAAEGWKIVGLIRLSPLFPYNLLNYTFGLTRVSLRDYTLASFVGMLPGTVMYVYIGSLAGDLAMIAAGEQTRSNLEWAAYIAGLAVTVAVSLYVTRLARRALAQKVDPVGEPTANPN